MKYSILGSSGERVSRVCLGSMTWGVQNNQTDADQQIEYALSRGINFIDTAEMYAVPPSPETYGRTESIIGHWLSANTNRRKDIVLATKIAGPGLDWIRQGSEMSGETVIAAVDGSLKRLQTDYIDLFQLHWPNRTSPHFGKHWPNMISFSDVDADAQSDAMLSILQGLETCIQAGKIRYCGLSDETPWGINEYLKLSEKYALPRMVSIQNEFSLLDNKDWPYLIENCVHENVAYLPWSPLGGGALTGKYLGGARPDGTRWSLIQRNGLFRDTEKSEAAIQAYLQLAKELAMTPAQLALAWCDNVDGVCSTIIGATTLAQLEENIDAFSMQLPAEFNEKVGDVLRRHPCPF